MTERRDFLAGVGGLGAVAGLGWVGHGGSLGAGPVTPAQSRLIDEIAELPVDDVHCHPIAPPAGPITVEDFLELISLSAFPLPKYFPTGVYEQWRQGDAPTRRRLSDAHRIDGVRSQIFRHARETVFVKYLVKELAGYFHTEARLEAILEARNAAAKDWDRYLGAMFHDAKIANVMLDTGYRQGLDATGVARFERAIEPCRSWRLSRVDEHEDEVLAGDDPFEVIEARFVARVRDALDHEGNLGRRSYGMKSYLLPRLGLIKPSYSNAAASRSWDAFRARRRSGAGSPDGEGPDRDQRWAMMADLLTYLHTLAIEECLTRDLPMQFHAGDGEAPGGIMRNQDPFLLEEVVRFDRDGVMRLPKIVVVHAGYPLVGRGAWLAQLYPNCYFDVSLMTPLIHQGLRRRYLEALEAVPISKILFGSDAYNAPELYWLAAKWGRRFLALALGDLVTGGQLGRLEAVEAAKMILHGNNRELYRVGV